MRSLQCINAEPLTDEFREKVKAGEGWVKGQLNPSPLETPVFIGVSDDLVKGEG